MNFGAKCNLPANPCNKIPTHFLWYVVNEMQVAVLSIRVSSAWLTLHLQFFFYTHLSAFQLRICECLDRVCSSTEQKAGCGDGEAASWSWDHLRASPGSWASTAWSTALPEGAGGASHVLLWMGPLSKPRRSLDKQWSLDPFPHLEDVDGHGPNFGAVM